MSIRGLQRVKSPLIPHKILSLKGKYEKNKLNGT